MFCCDYYALHLKVGQIPHYKVLNIVINILHRTLLDYPNLSKLRYKVQIILLTSL